MKTWLIAVLVVAVTALAIKTFFFPFKDRVLETKIKVEIDSTWVSRALTAEEKAKNLEEIVSTYRPRLVRVETIKNDTILQVISDTVTVLDEIELKFQSDRGRDSVDVTVTMYPALGMWMRNVKWNEDWTQIKTERITETNTVLKRLTWGLQFGAGYSTAGPAAYLGFGVNLNLGGL